MQSQTTDNTLGGLIPVNNPKALMSYYLGLFSLFPLLGFFMGIAAVIFGIQSLRLHKEFPQIRGRTHAIVGIACGTLFGLFNFLLLVFLLTGIIFAITRPAPMP